MNLERCRLVQFPKIEDERGNLSFIEGSRHVPFPIRRIYYLYDVPEGAARGGHAHRNLEQVIIAVSGSFDVILDDGESKVTYKLCRADEGLYLCPGIWRVLENFTSGSSCLVLASEVYAESDYFREYSEFIKAADSGVFSS